MWDQSTFSQNRERLFNQDVARLFFQRIKSLEQWAECASNEHFSVDGLGLAKSFVKKDGGEPPENGTRSPGADFRGDKSSNATHQSTSDPEARLAHTMMEHRSGLTVDVECTEFTGRAEVEAALVMLVRSAKPGSTVGVDKSYDQQGFVHGARKLKVTPHVAQKAKGSAIDGLCHRPEDLQANRGGLWLAGHGWRLLAATQE